MRRQTNKKIWSWAALALLGLTLVTSVFTSRIFARYTAGTGDGESARTAGFVQVSVTQMNGNYGAWAGGAFYACHNSDATKKGDMKVTVSASETAYRLYLTITVPAAAVGSVNEVAEKDRGAMVNTGNGAEYAVPLATFAAAEGWTQDGSPALGTSADAAGEDSSIRSLSYTYYRDIEAGNAGGSYNVFNPVQRVGATKNYDMKITDWRHYITIDKMPDTLHVAVTAKAVQLD